ncbi:unnamed protein product [Lampetra planeri]
MTSTLEHVEHFGSAPQQQWAEERRAAWKRCEHVGRFRTWERARAREDTRRHERAQEKTREDTSAREKTREDTSARKRRHEQTRARARRHEKTRARAREDTCARSAGVASAQRDTFWARVECCLD